MGGTIPVAPRDYRYYSISRTFSAEAGHRLFGHAGKCRRAHGHHYEFTISLYGPIPEKEETKILVDFSVLKGIIGKWIDDNIDHRFLVSPQDPLACNAGEIVFEGLVVCPYSPTAEGLARWVYEESSRLLRENKDFLHVLQLVTCQETPGCCASYGGG
jgi:6-pyruvoyltetrahydropterin/6-carboxytetrahydropterin synthase